MYEIINHGYCHSQYFEGQGTAFTEYSYATTGAGDNAKEAYEDAVESVYQICDYADKLNLPKRPKGIRKKDKIPSKFLKEPDNELFWYVSILWKEDNNG
ncbi:MAG: hypothetical protein ACOC56_01075 [Atribacterota bacterium]